MIIISHRGLWFQPVEQNTLLAFDRSFQRGFGVETDIRDREGSLVISHDMAGESSPHLDLFFESYSSGNHDLPLALNMKADGLYTSIKLTLSHFGIQNYFTFDMSIPEMLKYRESGLVFFTRQSEYEMEPALYEDASGVWMDEFNGHWITRREVERHMKNRKKVCIVSPELHGRTYQAEWKNYKELENQIGSGLMLCTDHPEEARSFFYD